MSWLVCKNFLRPLLSLSSLILPPCFSSMDFIMLKLPPPIHKGKCLFSLRIEIVSRRSSFCCIVCGKYTFVRCPWILVPLRWKVAWIRWRVAWKSSSETICEFHRMARPPEAPEASTDIELLLAQILFLILSIAVLLLLVSWRKTIAGFSCKMMFLIILCFEGLLSPLTFQEMSFM